MRVRSGSSWAGPVAGLRKRAALCHSCGVAPWNRQNPGAELRQGARSDAGTDLAHQIEVEMQVMNRAEPHAEDLAAAVQVPQIGARIALAGAAAAVRVQRPGVLLVAGVADVDDALGGEQVSVAGVARWHDAIEQIDA